MALCRPGTMVMKADAVGEQTFACKEACCMSAAAAAAVAGRG